MAVARPELAAHLRPVRRVVDLLPEENLFALSGKGSVLTHGGEAKVTPARYVNWVVLQRRGTRKRFAFVNTHFISGAWNKHPDRRARWRRHAEVLRTVVRTLRSRGLRVFVLGDFNRHRSIALPDQVFVPIKGTRAVALDQVYVTRGTRHSRAHRLPRNARTTSPPG